MKSILKRASLAVCLLSAGSAAFAIAPDFFDKLSSEERPVEDRMRDDARRPYQVMQLLGVEEGMTAIDLGAGGGWYTRVLSAAVGPDGHVISQAGPRGLGRDDGASARAMAQSLGNTEVSFENPGDLDAGIADIAVTALNLHHADDARGLAAMRDVLHVLKPGGVAAIIDHEGRVGGNNAGLHRIPSSQVKGWIEQAGLTIVTQSDILMQNADDLSLSAQDPILGRNSSRFLFVVRKPQ